MTILFYSMDGCGYCSMSKELLKNEIKNKKIKVLSHLKAPNNVSGFPHFVNGSKSFTGFPQTKENLYMQLDFSGGSGSSKKRVKRKLNKWQKFLKRNKGKCWSIAKMKREYKKVKLTQ